MIPLASLESPHNRLHTSLSETTADASRSVAPFPNCACAHYLLFEVSDVEGPIQAQIRQLVKGIMNVSLSRVRVRVSQIAASKGGTAFSNFTRGDHEDKPNRCRRDDTADVLKRRHMSNAIDNECGTGHPASVTQHMATEILPPEVRDELLAELLKSCSVAR